MSHGVIKSKLSLSWLNEWSGGLVDGSKGVELFGNFISSIYHEEGLGRFTSNTTTRWIVSYRWIEYVFVYGQDVSSVYESQGIVPFDCSSLEELVVCLKQYFQPYQNMYPGLWDCDWSNLVDLPVESIWLSQMIHQRSNGLGIWYMWYIKRWQSKLSHPWQTFAVWLPYSLNGYPVRLRNVGMRQIVSFDAPTLRGEDEDRACPIVIFQP